MGFWMAALPYIAAAAPSVMQAGSSLAGIRSQPGSDNAADQNELLQSRNFKFQREMTKKSAGWTLRNIVRTANQLGINPLAAMGVNPTTGIPSTPVFEGTNTSGLYESMGQSLGEAASRALDAKGRQILDLNVEIKKEELRKMRLQNVGIKQELERGAATLPFGPSPTEQHFGIMGQNQGMINGMPKPNAMDYPFTGSPGVEWMPSQKTISDMMGKEAGIGPQHQYTIDEKGYVEKLPSKDIQDAMESSTYNNLKYMAIRTGQHLKGFLMTMFAKTDKAKEWRKEMRKIRPKAPRGKEYRYDGLRDQWVLRPAEGEFYDGEYHKGFKN